MSFITSKDASSKGTNTGSPARGAITTVIVLGLSFGGASYVGCSAFGEKRSEPDRTYAIDVLIGTESSRKIRSVEAFDI